MDIAQRIQDLRKEKGLTQEELADQIGVSRQAVSKWESAQSLPEYDKLILLSDFFEVSTDYLMKGTKFQRPAEQQDQHDFSVKSNPNNTAAKTYAISGSSMILTGLLLALAIWPAKQNFTSIAIGLMFQVGGCALFCNGILSADSETKAKVKAAFFAFNVWTLSFMPFSILINTLAAKSLWISPYPIIFSGGAMLFTVLGCLIYVAACTAVSITQIKKFKNPKHPIEDDER